MKYKVTLKGRVYEVEVDKGEAMLLDEYEALAPVPSTPAAPAPAAAVALRFCMILPMIMTTHISKISPKNTTA